LSRIDGQLKLVKPADAKTIASYRKCPVFLASVISFANLQHQRILMGEWMWTFEILVKRRR